MERHELMDDLDRRLAAARPEVVTEVDPAAFDAELLARVRAQPIATGRRRAAVPRAVALPVAAGVAFAGVAGVMLAGGPDDVGGPTSAQAISSRTLHWLDPPAGTILHARSIETSDGLSTTRDVWQSADDPNQERIVVDGDQDYEQAGDALYDPLTDTIYDAPVTPTTGKVDHGRDGGATKDGAAKEKATQTEKRVAVAGQAGPKDANLPVGDPLVVKVQMLLQDGRMSVSGREVHDGVEAWKIQLNEGLGRPPWTLWVSADDGKPLEVVDPGRDANEPAEEIRWSTYEVLPKTDAAASAALTLTGAHPSAQVNHDPGAAAAAWERVAKKHG